MVNGGEEGESEKEKGWEKSIHEINVYWNCSIGNQFYIGLFFAIVVAVVVGGDECVHRTHSLAQNSSHRMTFIW